MSAFVVLNEVKKSYQMGEVVIHAVDGINFRIEKGDFAVIVGPSGAGKTTVLNILGGMDSCDSGDVLVDGINISKYNGKQLMICSLLSRQLKKQKLHTGREYCHGREN